MADTFDSLHAKLEAMKTQVPDAVKAQLYLGGLKIEEIYKKSVMSGDKSGKVYHRGKVSHTASAPGEAPANDTGRLVNSVHTDRVGDGSTVTVSVDAAYGAALEFGTSKMAARPALLPALRQVTPDIQAATGLAVKETINGIKS